MTHPGWSRISACNPIASTFPIVDFGVCWVEGAALCGVVAPWGQRGGHHHCWHFAQGQAALLPELLKRKLQRSLQRRSELSPCPWSSAGGAKTLQRATRFGSRHQCRGMRRCFTGAFIRGWRAAPPWFWRFWGPGGDASPSRWPLGFWGRGHPLCYGAGKLRPRARGCNQSPLCRLASKQ